MSDIVKGVLGGGWSLLVGWILPAGLNVLAFAFVVLPAAYPRVKPQQEGLALLAAAEAGEAETAERLLRKHIRQSLRRLEQRTT